MGAQLPQRTRRITLGCLGLLLAYLLFLACYFPWLAWCERREIVFEQKLLGNADPLMIFPTSKYIFANATDRVYCYQPPLRRGQPGQIEEVLAKGQIICMSQDGDAVYYCVQQQVAASTKQPDRYVVHKLTAPLNPPQQHLLPQEVSGVAYVAANANRVYVICDNGELLYYSQATDTPEEWRIQLSPTPNGSSAAQTRTAWNNYGISCRIAVDDAGIAYCIPAPDKVCAVNLAGEVLWSFQNTQGTAETMELARSLGQVFVLSGNGETIVLDCANGAVVWRVSGLSGNVYRDFGFPAVGPDGTALTLDNQYCLTLLQPGGTRVKLADQYSYNGQLARTADCDILALDSDELTLIDEQGRVRWSRNNGGFLDSLMGGGSYYYSEAWAISPAGYIVMEQDNKLYGIKPYGVTIAPAQP